MISHKTRQDDRALRPLERAINVPDSRREEFRRNVLQAHRQFVTKGVPTSYKDIPLLAAALEELLLPSLKDVSVMLRNNKKQLHLRETISRRLIDDYGLLHGVRRRVDRLRRRELFEGGCRSPSRTDGWCGSSLTAFLPEALAGP